MSLGWRKEVNHTTDSWQNWTTQTRTTHAPRVGQMFASSCSIITMVFRENVFQGGVEELSGSRSVPTQ